MIKSWICIAILRVPMMEWMTIAPKNHNISCNLTLAQIYASCVYGTPLPVHGSMFLRLRSISRYIYAHF